MSNPYMEEVQKFIDGVPEGLEMVNLGSTFSKFGFDYKYFGKKGFNLAVQAQPLAYDYRILKQYSGNINKGAIVVIVVCLFGFSVVNYPDDQANYKYYFFLDKNEIRGYSKTKEFVIKTFPYILKILSRSFAKRTSERLLRVLRIIRKNTAKHNDLRINGWMNEFDLKNVTDGSQADKLDHIFANTVESLRKILEICIKNEFRPVIINMPAIKEQNDEFSENFIENFYIANIKRANFCKAPVIDYFRDTRFNNSVLYENGVDCLNDRGRKFFAEIFVDDLKKLGL